MTGQQTFVLPPDLHSRYTSSLAAKDAYERLVSKERAHKDRIDESIALTSLLPDNGKDVEVITDFARVSLPKDAALAYLRDLSRQVDIRITNLVEHIRTAIAEHDQAKGEIEELRQAAAQPSRQAIGQAARKAKKVSA